MFRWSRLFRERRFWIAVGIVLVLALVAGSTSQLIYRTGNAVAMAQVTTPGAVGSGALSVFNSVTFTARAVDWSSPCTPSNPLATWNTIALPKFGSSLTITFTNPGPIYLRDASCSTEASNPVGMTVCRFVRWWFQGKPYAPGDTVTVVSSGPGTAIAEAQYHCDCVTCGDLPSISCSTCCPKPPIIPQVYSLTAEVMDLTCGKIISPCPLVGQQNGEQLGPCSQESMTPKTFSVTAPLNITSKACSASGTQLKFLRWGVTPNTGGPEVRYPDGQRTIQVRCDFNAPNGPFTVARAYYEKK